ncbi:MAG: ABC transporter substrate-binding protein, partial [Polyangiaceae bacterium]
MRRIWLAFALAVLATTSCGGPKSAHRVDRPFEIVVSSDAETLDPRYAVDAVGLRVTRMIHAGLVRLDPNTLEPIPYLARTWEWLGDKTLVIQLQPDLRFHSGAPFEARDVVETLRAFADPKVASRHARVVEAISGVHAEGSSIVVITLKRPHATLL